MKRNPWLVLVPLALVAVACSAPQEPALARARELPVPIKTVDDIQFKTSAFTFVRIQYSGVGNSWAVDWPDADREFSAHVQNLTGLSTKGDGLVLELTDSKLRRYPFIYIVEGGRMSLERRGSDGSSSVSVGWRLSDGGRLLGSGRLGIASR